MDGVARSVPNIYLVVDNQQWNHPDIDGDWRKISMPKLGYCN